MINDEEKSFVKVLRDTLIKEATRILGEKIVQQLFHLGYEIYNPTKDGEKLIFQRAVNANNGKNAYFITLKVFDLVFKNEWWRIQPETQFVRNGKTFNVTMLQAESPFEVETFFADIYYDLKCTPKGD